LPARNRNCAETLALSVVLETNVVGTGVPPTVTIEPLLKFDPLTVSTTIAAPAFAACGEKPDTVGSWLRMLTENDTVPPPGPGFVTIPPRVPAFAVIAAGRLNVMDEPITLPGAPARIAVVDAMNPAPLTVTVVAPLPAPSDAGETLDMTGAGFAGPVTMNATGPLDPPPGGGLETLTSKTLLTISALLGMTTVMAVLLLLVGDNDRLPT
jgi:hypothetical protein